MERRINIGGIFIGVRNKASDVTPEGNRARKPDWTKAPHRMTGLIDFISFWCILVLFGRRYQQAAASGIALLPLAFWRLELT